MPFIVIVTVITVVFVGRWMLYQTPVYEATARIRVDSQDFGISQSNLYKNFDVFSTSHDILTEVEVLKSDLILRKTFNKLPFDVDYFRVGKIRTSEIYQDSPFEVQYSIYDSTIFNKKIPFIIHDTSNFTLVHKGDSIKSRFGEELNLKEMCLSFRLKKNWKDGSRSGLADQFLFRINNFKGFKSNFLKEELFVKEVDKDIPIIRIIFAAEVPQKVVLFINTLAKTYIQDDLNSKADAAQKTVEFLDFRLEHIQKLLRQSEHDIEVYKHEQNYVNSQQSSDMTMKEVAQLKYRMLNLETESAMLDSLFAYVNNKGDMTQIAPNFEKYGGMIFTEMLKQVKLLQTQKQDLLLKYTEENDKVRVLDQKLAIAEAYILESIKRQKEQLKLEKAEISRALSMARSDMRALPMKEMKLKSLQRDFELYQKMYNFMMEKRTEAAIAQSANISFHRIIQHAIIPEKPIKPKRTFMVAISGFLAIVLSITGIYFRSYIRSKVTGRHQLEKNSDVPVLGVVRKISRFNQRYKNDLSAIATTLLTSGEPNSSKLIVITSSLKKEGKTFVASELSITIAKSGRKVCLIDFNLRNPQIHSYFHLPQKNGVSEFILGTQPMSGCIESSSVDNLDIMTVGNTGDSVLRITTSTSLGKKLDELKKEYDFVLIDTPACAATIDAIPLMSLSDHILYIVRNGFTSQRYIVNADLLVNKHQLKEMSFVLNSAHKATNYTGMYSGSRFSYTTKIKGFVNHIKHYYDSYF